MSFTDIDWAVLTVQATAAIGFVTVLLGAVTRFDRRASKWLSDRRTTRARIKRESEDYRVSDQSTQIEHLSRRVGALEERDAYRQAVGESLAAHVWGWRRRHAAAGHPYEAPLTPVHPEGIVQILPVWPYPTEHEGAEGS